MSPGRNVFAGLFLKIGVSNKVGENLEKYQ